MIKAFDYLDAPVLNCTGKDVPMPYAENLEKAALITPDEIVFSVKKFFIEIKIHLWTGYL